MRLFPMMRLVIRIGSGLLVAALIAIALTVPAPASDERCAIMTARSALRVPGCLGAQLAHIPRPRSRPCMSAIGGEDLSVRAHAATV
jgi:hypothetical protein